jgi:putative flippase GtrA
MSERQENNRFDQVIRKVITWGLKVFHIQAEEKTVHSLIQFVKFALVGVSNTVISYLLNIGTLKILEPYHLSWDYVAANVVDFLLSVLWSFYWNNRYVFEQKEGEKRAILPTLLRTYVAYAFTGIVLKNVLSYVWVDVMGISKYIAPIINLVISTPINFLINKIWAFKA